MLNETDMSENYRRFFIWAAQQDPSDLTYPHQTPERKLLGGGIGCEGLSDDDAGHIDRVLCRLKRENPDAYSVCLKVYRDGRSFRQLSKQGHGSRNTLGQLLAEADEFLRGYVFALVE